MKNFFKSPVLALVPTMLLAAFMLTGNAQAQSVSQASVQSPAPTDAPVKTKAKKKAAKSKATGKAADQGAKAKFIRGSEETTAERTTRLKRECKGGVNAGACAGFTR